MDAADGADPVDDMVFVELDGRVVGAAGVERVVREEVPNYQIWGTVHPDVRRRGLGTALLGWNLARARVRASREDPLVRVELATFSEDTEVGQRALLAKAGFETVRHFFLMRRQGLDDIPDAPLPDGLEIRPVTEDQWRTILAAENEAFRDHWGHREMTESDLHDDLQPGRARHRACGSSPGTATRSPASSRTGSGPRRTNGSASSAAGSSTSASAGRGAGAASPGRSPRPRWSSPARSGSTRRCSASIRRTRTARSACTRASGSTVREPRRGVPARPEGADRASGEQAPAVADELHPGPLATDRRRRPVAGQDADVVLELGQSGERRDHRVGVAAGQVDAAPRPGEQRVAAEQDPVVLGDEADRALGVAGRVEDPQADLAEAR